MNLTLKCCFLWLLAAFSVTLTALESDQYQAIVIHSDSAQLNAKTGKVTYIGNVVLEQGTIKITSDELILTRKEEGKLDSAKAIGKSKQATYQQQIKAGEKLTKARADTILYSQKNNDVIFTGNASLTQKGNLITGERIVYDITKEIANVGASKHSKQKKSRVKVVIQPAKKADKKKK